MFKNRTEAGHLLAEQLDRFVEIDPVVIGIARGGVPVAAAIAQRLSAPLDIAIVRKLGVPHQREVGFGAIGENGVLVLDEAVVQAATITEVERAVTERHERVVMEGQIKRFRRNREVLDLRDRTVILVDDGIAIGTTAKAGCAMMHAAGAAFVVLAVPVAAVTALEGLAGCADEVVALEQATDLRSVGSFYEAFSPVPDDGVVRMLDEADQRIRDAASARHR